MGRDFENRKASMFARWDKLAKAFTRIGRDIEMAVRAGGPSAESNPALRRVLQNARSANMPKDKVEAAIKRASGKDSSTWEVINYEGYAPHGIALLVETATDNPTRTVANVRVHFNKGGGTLGNSGSVAFLFQRMGVFRLRPAGIDREALELDLIDHGLEELEDGESDEGEAQLIIRVSFADFGRMQAALEERGLDVVSAESEYIPLNTTKLADDQADDVLRLIGRLEQDDDVQKVFHTMA